jgi:hypothetical protein
LIKASVGIWKNFSALYLGYAEQFIVISLKINKERGNPRLFFKTAHISHWHFDKYNQGKWWSFSGGAK